MAVNISVANLLDARLPDLVQALLARHGVPAPDLQLEITESVIMADPVRAMDVLARVGEMGVGLSLDDFGTGYSSLSHLKRLPVQELKIDRSFVMNLAEDGNDAAIVRSAVDLARNLGLRVVAEGVETAEAWRALADMGCDLAQGYYLNRPVAAGQLAQWLARRSAAASLEGT
jgi:EAL domain-containing protein (putative c-di-GMP-specific phosphodiesterase class I)